ncbi:hypothetical protein LTR86_006286 [Recurvomyces mirabilis]|nr:hypothetical protein LTR86_006286 [Recurvomyces mirabilis]
MRLLNTTTGELKDFTNAPPYAILSHRWGDDEISYDDYCKVLEANTEDATPKDERRAADIMAQSSCLKVVRFCLLARERGVGAELSEAINSMWAWFRDAAICLFCLRDVPPVQQHDHAFQFRRSEWFRRGWTLQEVLAPSVLLFYARDWSFIDMIDKRDAFARSSAVSSDFLRTLADISRIPIDCLSVSGGLQRISVARKMKDEACCLLGLFDVHMPLLYGEGSKAFDRLQRAILETSDDESIFAWRTTFGNRVTAGAMRLAGASYHKLFNRGMLAQDVRDFAGCGSLDHDSFILPTRLPYSITNKGLDMTANVTLVKVDQSYGGFEQPDTRIPFVQLCSTYVLFLGGLAGDRCAIALRCDTNDGPGGALIAIGRCYVEPNSADAALSGNVGIRANVAPRDNLSALRAKIGTTSTRRLFIRL